VKKIMMILLLVGFFNPITSFCDDGYTQVIFLDKGIKRKVLIPNDSSIKADPLEYPNKQLHAKEGIIIKFNTITDINVAQLELKYGLKLQTTILGKYLIFENNSSKTDIEIINDIILNEPNIQTLKPNWTMQNSTR